jgi:hypothetical protein
MTRTYDIEPSPLDRFPLADLRALLDYNWSAEAHDYKANPDDRHVFLAMRRLYDWLDDCRPTNRWTVVDDEGVEPGQQCRVLGRFATHDDASRYIETLPDAESGRYGLDGPADTETIVFHWSRRHGDCLDCGRPAAFVSTDAYGPDSTDHPKLCSVCAATHAADGEMVAWIANPYDEPVDLA